MIDKSAFLALCIQQLRQKLVALEQEQSALTLDTSAQGKSTAGDKHDTATAMAHLAQEQNQQMHAALVKQLQLFLQAQWREPLNEIAPGAYFITNRGHFFMLQAIGQIIGDEHTVTTLSMASPMGQKLLHKRVGDTIEMGQQRIEIHYIC